MTDKTNGLPVQAGYTTVASATVTRPADTTTYASGDLVANSTTFSSVTPMSFTVGRYGGASGMIRRARISKTSTTVTVSNFRLHLYKSSPTAANGDNAAWSTTLSGYIGSIDVTCDRAFTDGAFGAQDKEINFALASGQVLYGVLEARAAYVPTSAEVFTVELEVLQN